MVPATTPHLGRLRNLRAQISHRIARGLARPFDEQRLCAAADAAELAGA